MTSTINPDFGYILEAKNLISFVPEDRLEDFEECIEEEDCEWLEEMLGQWIPDKMPAIKKVFSLSSEDWPYDDMKIETPYVQFDESDLYIKKMTPKASALQKVLCDERESIWELKKWGEYA